MKTASRAAKEQVLAQLAEREGYVANQVIEQVQASHVATLFFLLLVTTEGEEGGRACFGGT